MSTHNNEGNAETFAQAANAGASAFDIDADAYMGELDDLDLTKAQKRELLETLWSIMRSFVEMGFSVDICAALADGDGAGDSPAVK